MLFSLQEIQNYQLRAQDGDFGEIKSFLIDDDNWVVRYLMVKVGNRDVLLSVMAMGAPDPIERVVPTNLSRDRIMNSPEIRAGKPLSRDIERQLSDYYEWPYYWEPGEVPNTRPGDLTAVPLIDMELDKEAQEDQALIPQTGEESSSEKKNESHLHDTKVLFGETIHTTNDDRNAGRLTDMVTQDEDWNLLYLVVDTGGLLTNNKVLVAPSWVTQIDELDNRIDVQLSAETIQNSPNFNTIGDITQEYQTKLNDYYRGR